MVAYESWKGYVQELRANQQPNNRFPFSEVLTGQTPPCAEALAKLGETIKLVNIVEMVTPVNAAQERKKWLEEAKKGNFTNPQYRYNERLIADVIKLEANMKAAGMLNLYEWAEKLIQATKIHVPSAVAGLIIQQRINETQQAIEMAKGIQNGVDAITAKAIEELLGMPSDSTIQTAKFYAKSLAKGQGTILSDSEGLSASDSERLIELEFDAEGIARVFNWAAEKCGFAGTRPVVVSESATAIDVRDKSSQGAVVVIPQRRHVTGKKLVSLTAHEVLCHWRDSENIGSTMAGNLKSHDEILYEGHAMTVEREVDLILNGEATLMPKPWYVLAIELAKNGSSFAEVARALYPMILEAEGGEERALGLTYTSCQRVFRGATNTSGNQSRYAFTKDRAYFEGVMLVDELRTAGLGNLAEYGILGVTDLSHIATFCRFDTERLKYAYSINLIYELIEKMLYGDFSS